MNCISRRNGRNRFGYFRSTLGGGLALLFLAACGGGDGGGGGTPPAATVTISGTAAAGLPLSTSTQIGTVEVFDSTPNTIQPRFRNIPIDPTNGLYSVNVSGLNPPFAFLATGTVGGNTVSLYSAATKEDMGGTINITPFTDLIVRQIAATTVDTYINSGGYSNLTKPQLDAQRATLTNALGPALQQMGIPAGIDLLRAVFNADGTDLLDKFMDAVKVSITSPTTATISNIMDNANALIVNTQQGTITGALPTTDLGKPGNPIDLILQSFKTFSSLFKTQLPSSTDPTLQALVSSTFLDNGRNRPTFLTDITTDPRSIGLNFSNVVVDTVNDAAGTAQVHFIPRDAAGISLAHNGVDGSISMNIVKTAGVWQIAGNRRIASVNIRTEAQQQICAAPCTPAGTTLATGFNLGIENPGLQSIGSAVVTGPGLPAQGVTLVAQANQSWLGIPNYPCQGCTDNFYRLTDAEIATVLPNSIYTIKLYDLSVPTPFLMATYTDMVAAAPVLNTQLSTVAFPTITSGMQNLAGISAATLIPSWTIPPGLWGDLIAVDVFQGALGHMQERKDLTNKTATLGTSTLVITAPPGGGSWTNGTYWINAFDQNGGFHQTNYPFL